jgi:catechol 2,3-dioxygenase-like lactoylglutathione lyase family enzyme
MVGLGSSRITAFVATTDAQRARAFYEGVLGLAVTSEDAFALTLEVNGTPVRVAIVREIVVAPYTVLGFGVTDIAETIRALRGRGVRFESYEFLTQDGLGVWTSPSGARIAWFKDPDGNVLSLTQTT